MADYVPADGGRPPLINQRLINLYSEPTPQGPSKITRYTRPSLFYLSTVGAGPIRAFFKWFAKRIAVSGNAVYLDFYTSGANVLGNVINSTGPVRSAHSDEQVVIIAGGKAYLLDGLGWVVEASAADNTWSSVAYGNFTFVAVAATGVGNRVMTSLGGQTWTIRVSAADNDWSSVCYAPSIGLFVAVSVTGVGNRVMTSPTGTTWTARVSAADNNWQGVCWAPSLPLLVAVAGSGAGNRVMTSPNGTAWTIRVSAADNDWRSVCWSPELGLFVAVGASGAGNRVMTSVDGITWALRSSAADNSWTSVCWSPEIGLFVAVANSGVGNRVMTSPNGIVWTARVSAADNQWISVCWSPELGLFVAVALTGVANRCMTSINGIDWTFTTTVVDNDWRSVAWGPGLNALVAVGSTGAGNRAIYSQGVGFAQITDPELPSTVVDVLYLAGRFIYLDGNSSAFWWSEIGDAANIAGLSFATQAEGEALLNTGASVLSGQIAFFSIKEIEWWVPTDNIDAPFIRSSGRHVDRGSTSILSIQLADNTLFFVGTNRVVYRVSDVPERVSDFLVEEDLRVLTPTELSQVTSYVINFNGHEFYVMNLPTVTWAYDISQKEWATWASVGRSHFRPNCSDPLYGLMGDTYSGRIYNFTGSIYADQKDDNSFTDYIDRTFGIYYPLGQGTLRNFNVVLRTKRGVGVSSGQGSAPVASMRYSDDEGANWSAWTDASLGALGVTGDIAKAVWLHQGTIRAPGRMFEFRCTDPVEYIPYDVKINMPRP